MANEPIKEVVVNGNSYPIEGDNSAIEAQLTAEDDLKFQFSKSGTAYGYKDADGNFVPFKNPTGTKSITANGTYDVTDYASASVNVGKTVSFVGVYTQSSQTQVINCSIGDVFIFFSTNSQTEAPASNLTNIVRDSSNRYHVAGTSTSESITLINANISPSAGTHIFKIH